MNKVYIILAATYISMISYITFTHMASLFGVSIVLLQNITTSKLDESTVSLEAVLVGVHGAVHRPGQSDHVAGCRADESTKEPDGCADAISSHVILKNRLHT